MTAQSTESNPLRQNREWSRTEKAMVINRKAGFTAYEITSERGEKSRQRCRHQ